MRKGLVVAKALLTSVVIISELIIRVLSLFQAIRRSASLRQSEVSRHSAIDFMMKTVMHFTARGTTVAVDDDNVHDHEEHNQ